MSRALEDAGFDPLNAHVWYRSTTDMYGQIIARYDHNGLWQATHASWKSSFCNSAEAALAAAELHNWGK